MRRWSGIAGIGVGVLLSLLVAAAAACAGDPEEEPGAALFPISGIAETGDARILLYRAPRDEAINRIPFLDLEVNGLPAVVAPPLAGPNEPWLGEQPSVANAAAFAAAPDTMTIELLDDAGETAYESPAIGCSADERCTLVVHGDSGAPRSTVFVDSAAAMSPDHYPAELVHVRFLNLDADGAPLRFWLGDDPIEEAALDYGQVWEGDLPTDPSLAMSWGEGSGLRWPVTQTAFLSVAGLPDGTGMFDHVWRVESPPEGGAL